MLKNVKKTSFGLHIVGCGLGGVKMDQCVIRVDQSGSEWVRARFSTAQSKLILYSIKFFHYCSMKIMYTIKGKLCKQRIKNKNKNKKSKTKIIVGV